MTTRDGDCPHVTWPVPTRRRVLVWAACAAALTLSAWANHFHNGFHFDDSHAIVDNTLVRDLAHVPRFFVDATTFSVLPLNQSYRPVLQTTLAIDYWIAGGYRPVVFQIDTFVWFVLQLICMWALYSRVIAAPAHARTRALEDPRTGAPEHPSTLSTSSALAATALYALHPVTAETVNYVIQRGEILSTLGVAAALWMYAAEAVSRRSMLWLIPLAVGALAKPPALVFPLVQALYLALIERPSTRDERRAAVRDVAVAAGACVALGAWMAMRTPESYTTGGGNATLYWLTQPWVAGRYFSAFFAPVHLSADNDWTLVSGWSDPRTLIGFAFVAALLWTIVRAARSRLSAPIAFGLGWFAIALLPTSLTPLAEVANDHRMFFPFVGLTLAATWTLWLLLDLLREFHLVRRATVPVTAAMLIACAVGVHERNEVWRSDETLWLDVTRKSPMNGRGWMNYGLARMAQADYATAIDSFERARTLTPDYSLVHINLGIAFGAVGRTADAERAFRRAQDLAPDDWRSHYYYARWLGQVGRTAEALSAAATAVSQNPADEASRVLLARLRATTPDDPDALVARSLAEYRAGQYRESLASAASALRLRPDYAEAYNNMAAAHNAMGEWDAGIIAATEAIRLKPGLQIAQNNLAYARQQKAREAAAAATGKRD